jgi:hypothetical protein
MSLTLSNRTKRLEAQPLRVETKVEDVKPPYEGFSSFLSKEGLVEEVSVAYFYDPKGTLVATCDWVRGWCTPENGPSDPYVHDQNESIPEYSYRDRPITELLILLLLRYWEDTQEAPLFISDEDIAFSKYHPNDMKNWRGEWDYGVRCNRVDGGYYITLEALEQK